MQAWEKLQKAKMGVSASTTYKTSTVITTYLNSDQLGDVIINFGDDVIIKDEMEIIDSESESEQNIYRPVVNPKYNSGYYKIGENMRRSEKCVYHCV